MSTVTFARIPGYTVELLLQAKLVLATQQQPEHLPQAMKQLQDAVIEFERHMPLRDGEIQEA